MSKFWMITNRNRRGDGLGRDRAKLSYWLSDAGPLDRLNRWQSVDSAGFKKELIATASRFPAITDPADHEKQKHVTIFIHGYNNDWTFAAQRYQVPYSVDCTSRLGSFVPRLRT